MNKDGRPSAGLETATTAQNGAPFSSHQPVEPVNRHSCPCAIGPRQYVLSVVTARGGIHAAYLIRSPLPAWQTNLQNLMHISSSALGHLSGLPAGLEGLFADCWAKKQTTPRGVVPAVSRRNAGSPTTVCSTWNMHRFGWKAAIGQKGHRLELFADCHDQRQWPSLRCARLPRTRSTRRRVIREPRHLQLKVSGPPSRETYTDCLNSPRHRYMPPLASPGRWYIRIAAPHPDALELCMSNQASAHPRGSQPRRRHSPAGR